MRQHELEIVNQLIQASEQGSIEWRPTDIRWAYYGEYLGTPYISGMVVVPLDESHEYYGYYVSARDSDWEQVAYAEEDDMTFSLDAENEPIRKLHDIAARQSSDRVAVQLNKPSTKDSIKVEDNKKPKIFISHSSADTLFVKSFVDLLSTFGFLKKDIFCSSIPGSGIKLGEDIFEVILQQFQQYNLYVIFIHSPRFYRSPISLNEMGAAWALRKRYCSILTKDMEYNAMKAVVDDRKIAIKVDEQNAADRVVELLITLFDFFEREKPHEDEMRQQCECFLQYVNSLYYTQFGEVEKKQYWKVATVRALTAVLKRFGIVLQ